MSLIASEEARAIFVSDLCQTAFDRIGQDGISLPVTLVITIPELHCNENILLVAFQKLLRRHPVVFYPQGPEDIPSIIFRLMYRILL